MVSCLLSGVHSAKVGHLAMGCPPLSQAGNLKPVEPCTRFMVLIGWLVAPDFLAECFG